MVSLRILKDYLPAGEVNMLWSFKGNTGDCLFQALDKQLNSLFPFEIQLYAKVFRCIVVAGVS